jgi:hypothetical protein
MSTQGGLFRAFAGGEVSMMESSVLPVAVELFRKDGRTLLASIVVKEQVHGIWLTEPTTPVGIDDERGPFVVRFTPTGGQPYVRDWSGTL